MGKNLILCKCSIKSVPSQHTVLSFLNLRSSSAISNCTNYWLLTMNVKISFSATEISKEKCILSLFFLYIYPCTTSVTLLPFTTLQKWRWTSKLRWARLSLYLFSSQMQYTVLQLSGKGDWSRTACYRSRAAALTPFCTAASQFCAAFQENSHQMAAAHKPQIVLPKASTNQSFYPCPANFIFQWHYSREEINCLIRILVLFETKEYTQKCTRCRKSSYCYSKPSIAMEFVYPLLSLNWRGISCQSSYTVWLGETIF